MSSLSGGDGNPEEPLQESVEKVLSGSDGTDINPWRDPISLITWGFLLTCFTLNFLMLQYILPTIGAASLYIGFRSLRNTNKWFRAGWILAIIKLIWQLVNLIMCATPIISLSKNNMIIGSIVIILQIALLSVFRTATRLILYNAGIKPNKDPALALIIWTFLVIIGALTKVANIWIVFLPLIIFYFANIHSLYKIGDDLGELPEALVEAPVKINNKVIVWGYLIISCSLVLICCIIVNHMNLEASRQVAVSERSTRTELVRLGFPKDIIQDIPNKDISKMNGAIYVSTNYATLDFDIWKGVTGTSENNTANSQDKKGLGASTIFVEMPNNLAYMVVYFKWKKSAAFWQDGFTISGDNGMELLDGALLFQKKGVDYSAPIPRLKCQEVTTQSFFDTQESRKILGAVSYPFTSKDQRGFVIYRINIPKDILCVTNCLNYIHYNHPFLLPYVEVEKKILNGFFDDNVKQAYVNFETQLYRDTNKYAR